MKIFLKNIFARFTANDKNTSGVSLLIAIIFMCFFMLLMADMAQTQLRVIQSMRNRDIEGKVRYLAEGAQEMAALWVHTGLVGGNGSSTTEEPAMREYEQPLLDIANEAGYTNCNVDPANPCVGFSVQGRSLDTQTVRLDGVTYFSVPTKGTGDARSECDWPASYPDQTANDGCNWNKLSMGQSVEIPLYYEDETGVRKLTLDTGTDFKLRVRTPCYDSRRLERFEATSSTCERAVLFPMVAATNFYRKIDKDPVLVQWMITDAGGDEALVAADAKDPDVAIHPNERKPNSYENTEITGGRINDAAEFFGRPGELMDDHVVLQKVYPFRAWDPDYNYKGNKVNMERIRGTEDIQDFVNRVPRPILRLTLVERPMRDADGVPGTDEIDWNDWHLNVPYLEYQLLTTGMHVSVSDTKSFVRSWAKFGDYEKHLTLNIQRPQSMSGFAMESF